MPTSPFITVFTPTFNRAHTIKRVYDSLTNQVFRDFEWVIVDDGSKDNTKILIDKWKSESDFTIHYSYQENRGKHIAINRGAEIAKGELFLIADSDDGFVPESLQVFYDKWMAIEPKADFAGVWCLCQDEEGKIVGDQFPSDDWDAYYYSRLYEHKLKGEKWHIDKLSVIKEFPFPETKVGDGFYFGESYIWNKIYKKYKGRHINQPLRLYYDSPDGIMAQIANNPHRFYTIRIGALAQINNDIQYFWKFPKQFLFTFQAYIKSSRKLNVGIVNTMKDVKPITGKCLIVLLSPLSWILGLIRD